MRIDATSSRPVGTQLGTLTAGNSGQAAQVPTVGQQVQERLFGRPQPRLLDASQFPDLAAYLRQYEPIKRKLAMLAGDRDSDYVLVLADDATAAVNPEGVIYVGAALLRGYMADPEAIVGVLAHEIGHRPKQWRARRHAAKALLGGDQLDQLARHEETRADMFAGAAMAELGMQVEPLVRLLAAESARSHPDYHPVAIRADILRRAFEGRAVRADARRKYFPDQDRHTSPGGYLGEY